MRNHNCFFKKSKINFLVFAAQFMQLVQKFKLKLSTSLVNEIMNAFEGPRNTVDQEQLKSFYLEEYPETIAALSKLKKKKFKIAK
jgi:hypothetical protein